MLVRLNKLLMVALQDDSHSVNNLRLKTWLSKTYYPVKIQQTIQVPPAGEESFENYLCGVAVCPDACEFNFYFENG